MFEYDETDFNLVNPKLQVKEDEADELDASLNPELVLASIMQGK